MYHRKLSLSLHFTNEQVREQHGGWEQEPSNVIEVNVAGEHRLPES